MKNVFSLLRQYVSKCSACPSCRNGSCELLKLFRENAASAPLPDKDSFEDRALAIHQECDDLLCDQLSLADLIEAVNNELSNNPVPDTQEALSHCLEELRAICSWVGRMSKNRRLLLTDTLGAAIEHVVGCLDFSYLERGLDLEILFLSYFPWYKSRRVFKNCGYPDFLVDRYLGRAWVVNQKDLSMVPDGNLRLFAPAEETCPVQKALSLHDLFDKIFSPDNPFRHAYSFLPDKDLVVCAPCNRFPKCGVREIDQLGRYHQALPQIGRYIEDPLVESFRNQCEEKAAKTASRLRDSWFIRVAKTLDAFNEYAQEAGDTYLKDIAMNLFDALETELNAAAGIGYVWELCVRNDIVSIAVDYYDEQWKGAESSAPNAPAEAKSAPRKADDTKSDILTKLEDYLQVLVTRHYCTGDYKWINARHGGYSNAQAYWVAHLFQLTFEEFQLSEIGALLGVPHIGSYASRVNEFSPFKTPLQNMFLEAGLPLKLPPLHN